MGQHEKMGKMSELPSFPSIIFPKIYMSQIAKADHELSTMVGENFEIYRSQIAKTDWWWIVSNSLEFQIWNESNHIHEKYGKQSDVI